MRVDVATRVPAATCLTQHGRRSVAQQVLMRRKLRIANCELQLNEFDAGGILNSDHRLQVPRRGTPAVICGLAESLSAVPAGESGSDVRIASTVLEEPHVTHLSVMGGGMECLLCKVDR